MHPRRTRSAPTARARVNFRTVFSAGRVRYGGIFRRSLRATSKKRSSTFLARKNAPQTKSWLRLCPQAWSSGAFAPGNVVKCFVH